MIRYKTFRTQPVIRFLFSGSETLPFFTGTIHTVEGLGTMVKDVFPPSNFVYLRYTVRIPGFTYLMGRLFSLQSLLTHSSIMGSLSLKLSNEDIAKGYISSFVHSSEIRKDFAKACRHWLPQHTLEAAELLKTFTAPVLILWGDKTKNCFQNIKWKSLCRFLPCAMDNNSAFNDLCAGSTPEQTIEAILGFCGINITAHQRDRTAT